MSILKNTYMNWSKCEPYVQTQAQLRRWYSKFPGKWLGKLEQQLLKSVLSDVFGYYLMHVGLNNRADYLDCSRISLRIIMGSCSEEATLLPDKLSDHCVLMSALPEYFPIGSDSLDVVVVSHTLEFSENPHQVLRETDRVLIPEGHVVILGFNP